MMEKITFKTFNNEKLDLWVYDDGNPETDKNRTALIWIHGGGWNSGNPNYFGDDYNYFTKQNIVCFGVEYRLVSKDQNDVEAIRLQGAIEDCMDSVSYVRKNANKFGIDPQKVIVIGESAGGHLALCLATDIVNRFDETSIPNALIAYNPVVETVARWSQWAAKYDGISFSVEEFNKRYKILKSISPYHNIVKNNIPLLLLTGIDDRVVFPGEVMDFFEKYKAAGNEAEIEFYANTTHAFALPAWYDKGMESRDKSLEVIEGFLKKHKYL